MLQDNLLTHVEMQRRIDEAVQRALNKLHWTVIDWNKHSRRPVYSSQWYVTL